MVQDVTALLDDEERWIRHIEDVSSTLDEEITKQKLGTREQIRDYIRTDTALKKFIEDRHSQG